MAQPLGSVQQSVLSALREYKRWHVRAGWTWTTPSGTTRLMESLVRAGVAEKRNELIPNYGGREVPTDVYYPADAKAKNPGGRPRGPLMPCGWKCGAKLTASEIREHFTTCPKRPEVKSK
jgi:hypothetical protein